MSEDYQTISPSLRLRVDHRWQAEKINRQLGRKASTGRGNADTLPFGVWADHFAYYLVAPTDDGKSRNILQSDFDRWGLSFQQACAEALNRLFAKTPFEFGSLIGAGSAYELHESTWVADDHAARLTWPPLADLPVAGERLIFPLSRNKMIITGSDSLAGLATVLRKIPEIPWTDALPPLALSGERENFSVWPAPVNHPYHASLKRFADSYLSKIYAQQYNILLAECGCDEDLFIAKFMLTEDRRSCLRSQATIFQGVRATSLPKVDRVIFVIVGPPGQDLRIVAVMSWEVMQAMMRDRLTKLESYPERYVLEGFPTDEELNKFCPDFLPQIAVEYPPNLRLEILNWQMSAPIDSEPAARPTAPVERHPISPHTPLSFAPNSSNSILVPPERTDKMGYADVEF